MSSVETLIDHQTADVGEGAGPHQFGCATRGETERMARCCAKRSGVNLSCSEGPSGFTLLARFRGAARAQPRRMPSIDAPIGAVPNRRSTTIV
jgi:hypothetical protein